MAMLEGQEIANPPRWRMLVTFCRAIQELSAGGARRIDRETRAADQGFHRCESLAKENNLL